MKRKRVQIPALTGIGQRKRYTDLFVDKPPKLRFKPGQIFKYEGSLWYIIYCYRIKQEPNIWIYCLEEIREKDRLVEIFEELGCGDLTHKVVYECFRDSWEAMMYFADIPANGDRISIKTQDLLNKGQLISSGEIIK